MLYLMQEVGVKTLWEQYSCNDCVCKTLTWQ